jgi:hypothetical protein
VSFLFSVKRPKSFCLTTLHFPHCLLRCVTLLLSNCQEEAAFLGQSLCRSVAASFKVITKAKQHNKHWLNHMRTSFSPLRVAYNEAWCYFTHLSTSCCRPWSLLSLHILCQFTLQTMRPATISRTLSNCIDVFFGLSLLFVYIIQYF